MNRPSLARRPHGAVLEFVVIDRIISRCAMARAAACQIIPQFARDVLRDNQDNNESGKCSQQRPCSDIQAGAICAENDGVKDADSFDAWFEHWDCPVVLPCAASIIIGKAALL